MLFLIDNIVSFDFLIFTESKSILEIPFKNAAIFAGISYDDEKIKKAIEFSDFNRLNEEEKKKGFKERIAKDSLFFREGNIGGWRNHLSEEQVNLIIKEHQKIMKRFGYLDNKGKIVY